LEQRPDSRDRRIRILVLTALGREKMKSIRHLIADLESQMTRGVSDRSLQSISSTLDQVAENIEQSLESDSEK
jgi:DNA-binding MarR family transcriptional regulator